MATRPFLLLVFGVIVAGCQMTPDQALVGAWSTNRKLTKLPASFMGGRRSAANGIYATQLKLSADHTFVLSGFRQIGGKWSYANGIVTLTPSETSSDVRWGIGDGIRQFHVDPDLSSMKITVPMLTTEVVLVLDKTA